MLSREKALVQRLEKEPFALIGIDTDQDLEVFNAQRQKSGVTWRNVWEGPVRPGLGPLCRAWRVVKFPTVYVLDHRGVVRFVDLRGDDLDRSVDALLAELKAARANR
jgi:hypothetical protein